MAAVNNKPLHPETGNAFVCAEVARQFVCKDATLQTDLDKKISRVERQSSGVALTVTEACDACPYKHSMDMVVREVSIAQVVVDELCDHYTRTGTPKAAIIETTTGCDCLVVCVIHSNDSVDSNEPCYFVYDPVKRPGYNGTEERCSFYDAELVDRYIVDAFGDDDLRVTYCTRSEFEQPPSHADCHEYIAILKRYKNRIAQLEAELAELRASQALTSSHGANESLLASLNASCTDNNGVFVRDVVPPPGYIESENATMRKIVAQHDGDGTPAAPAGSSVATQRPDHVDTDCVPIYPRVHVAVDRGDDVVNVGAGPSAYAEPATTTAAAGGSDDVITRDDDQISAATQLLESVRAACVDPEEEINRRERLTLPKPPKRARLLRSAPRVGDRQFEPVIRAVRGHVTRLLTIRCPVCGVDAEREGNGVEYECEACNTTFCYLCMSVEGANTLNHIDTAHAGAHYASTAAVVSEQRPETLQRLFDYFDAIPEPRVRDTLIGCCEAELEPHCTVDEVLAMWDGEGEYSSYSDDYSDVAVDDVAGPADAPAIDPYNTTATVTHAVAQEGVWCDWCESFVDESDVWDVNPCGCQVHVNCMRHNAVDRLERDVIENSCLSCGHVVDHNYITQLVLNPNCQEKIENLGVQQAMKGVIIHPTRHARPCPACRTANEAENTYRVNCRNCTSMYCGSCGDALADPHSHFEADNACELFIV